MSYIPLHNTTILRFGPYQKAMDVMLLWAIMHKVCFVYLGNSPWPMIQRTTCYNVQVQVL